MKRRTTRLLSTLLVLCMVLTLFPASIWAIEDTITEGSASIFAEEARDADLSAMCGNDLTWSLENGILSISGTGPMFDYEGYVSEDLSEYLDTPWFDQRDEITEIVINNGVTSIGVNAFAACWRATSVSIPDSVTDIGENAFDGCPAFVEAKPKNIEASIMPLASATGNVRYSVLVLDVSGSMTTAAMTAQKAAAIKFCNSLLSADGDNYVAVITFGSSVQTISDFSQDIDALTTAINRISTSGMTYTIGALEKADELLSAIPESAGRSIVLCSDGLPNQGTTSTSGLWTSADSSSYYRYANAVYNKAIELMQKYDLFTLGFFHSLSGKDLEFAREFMEAIQDTGYYEVTDPDDLEFTFGDIAGDVTTPGHSGIIFVNVPKDKYVIHVVNDEGRNLSGVTVTCNGTPGQTNNNGLVTFDKSLFASTPKITATATGYTEWSNEHSNWSFDGRGYATIKMYPTSASKYKLSECIYSDTNDANPEPGLLTPDLLVKTKTVTMYNELWGNDLPGAGNINDAMNSGKFYLSCKAIDSSSVQQYELWQGTKKITTSTNGKFSLEMDKSGAPFVEGGKCFVRAIGADGEYADTNINLQFERATVNSDALELSFTGGNSSNSGKLSFKVGDNIPFVGGGTFSFSIPGSIPIYVDVSPDGKTLQVGINIKKDWERGDKDKDKVKKSSVDKLKELITDARTAGSLGVGRKKNFSAEQLKAFTELQEKSKEFSFLKSGSIDFIGYLEGDFSAKTLKGHAMIKGTVEAPKFGFTAWVVVVPVTANIKLEGGAKAIGELGYDWANAQWFGYLDVGFFGSLEAFGGIGVGKAIGAGAYGSAELSGDIRIIGTPWGLRNVDLTGELGLKAYLAIFTYEKPFAYNTWNIYTANNVKSLSAIPGSGTAALSMYEADSYKIHDLNYLSEESGWMGTPIMLLDASAATQLNSLLRDTYRNAQPVMVSANDALYATFLRADRTTNDVYAAVTKFDGGTWSEPIRVDSNAVMDGAPSLCVDSSGNIWLAYARTTDDVVSSLITYAKNQEIVVGSINPNTLQFTESATYAGTGYAHLQQIALVNGVPTLVWADSTVTADNDVLWPATSDLYTATYTGGSWGTKQLVTHVDKPILQIAAGGSDMVYVVDEDGQYAENLSATEEQYVDQSVYRVSDPSTPVGTNVQGNVTYSVLPDGTADFVWNETDCLKTAGGKEIPAAGISDEYAVAGSRIYYSCAGEQGAHLTTVIYDNGTWSNPVTLTGGERYLENLSAVRWNGTDYVMGMNTAATITDTDVIDAKNLVWGQVMPTSDLRLDGIDYDADEITAGDTVPVTLTVTNAGDHTVSSVEVFINGSNQGEYPLSIAPGASMEITVNVTCPAVLTQYQFSIGEIGQDDFTPDDNTDSVGIGYADLEVTAEEERIEDSSSMVVYVTNKGVALATGSVTVTDDSGNVVTNRSFAGIGPGDTFVLSIPMSASGVYTATAALANGEDDLYTYNNSDTIAVGTDFESVVTYTISANASLAEGGNVIGSGTYNGGTSVTVTAMANSGYRFVRWTEDGATVSTSATYTFNATADRALIAIFAPINSGGGGGSSSSSSSYQITTPATENGTVTVTPKSAASGAKVTITATPDDGYTTDSVTVTDRSGNSISVTDNGDGTYTFTMPSSQVTINATFTIIGKSESDTSTGTLDETAWISPFADVSESDWFYNEVAYVVQNGLMNGVGNGQFNPSGTTTRGMIMTILARQDGLDTSGSSPWYQMGMEWAVRKGVSDGTGPEADITREQLATMLWRYAGEPVVVGNLSGYPDAGNVHDWASVAMIWAVENGIINGSDGKLNPQGNALRSEAAAMLTRYCKNIIK